MRLTTKHDVFMISYFIHFFSTNVLINMDAHTIISCKQNNKAGGGVKYQQQKKTKKKKNNKKHDI